MPLHYQLDLPLLLPVQLLLNQGILYSLLLDLDSVLLHLDDRLVFGLGQLQLLFLLRHFLYSLLLKSLNVGINLRLQVGPVLLDLQIVYRKLKLGVVVQARSNQVDLWPPPFDDFVSPRDLLLEDLSVEIFLPFAIAFSFGFLPSLFICDQLLVVSLHLVVSFSVFVNLSSQVVFPSFERVLHTDCVMALILDSGEGMLLHQQRLAQGDCVL